MVLKRIKLTHKVNESEITSHMMHSPRHQTSLFPMDTLVSRRAPSNTSDPSSNRLCSDDDITAQIASAKEAMGALKEVWRNPHLDVFTKYLLVQAIPMNLLLWGVETWSLRLRKSQLDQLEVFLHHSIRRILQISISAVKEEKFV
jgi:hypothetical protein